MTEVADYTDIDICVNYRVSQVSGVGANSGAVSTLRQRVDDVKISIASGTFTNPPRPVLVGENWAQVHQQEGKVTLSYRTWFVL